MFEYPMFDKRLALSFNRIACATLGKGKLKGFILWEPLVRPGRVPGRVILVRDDTPKYLVDLVGFEPTTSSMPWTLRTCRPLILNEFMTGGMG
jgi:hypothetical protein